MKKKLSALIIVLILATAVMAGCSGGSLFGCNSTAAITLATGTNAPWFNYNYYEKTVYDIERYAYGEKNADGTYPLTTIATGEYTYEMIGIKTLTDIPGDFPVPTLGLSGDTRYNYTILRMTFELEYNADSGALSGKTDTMTSDLLFYTSDLMPIYLIRSENYQSDGNKLDITTDYINLKNKVTVNGETTETEVKSGVFDNDLMFYVMRARSSLAPGTSDALEIFSPKDSAIQGKAVTHKMTFSTTATFTNASDKYLYLDKGDKFIQNSFRNLPEKTEDGYKVERMYTGVGINEKNSGPYTYLSYATDNFYTLGQETSKVCLKMDTIEYDSKAPVATPAHSTHYTLSDYSIVKQ